MDKSYGNLLVFQIKNTKETKDSNPEVETGVLLSKISSPRYGIPPQDLVGWGAGTGTGQRCFKQWRFLSVWFLLVTRSLNTVAKEMHIGCKMSRKVSRN